VSRKPISGTRCAASITCSTASSGSKVLITSTAGGRPTPRRRHVPARRRLVDALGAPSPVAHAFGELVRGDKRGARPARDPGMRLKETRHAVPLEAERTGMAVEHRGHARDLCVEQRDQTWEDRRVARDYRARATPKQVEGGGQCAPCMPQRNERLAHDPKGVEVPRLALECGGDLRRAAGDRRPRDERHWRPCATAPQLDGGTTVISPCAQRDDPRENDTWLSPDFESARS
jgi:hypothetical protein